MNRLPCRQALLFFVSLLLLISFDSISQSKPISLHPSNPHYFLYKEKPVILITSGEHYGAVLNPDFNFIAYLDELKSKGLNLTRTFTGAYVELPGAFHISNNTLAPAPGKMLCPWARSNDTGYKNGGNKFDLEKWNDIYFTRLKSFFSAASQRGIMVELALFCPFYDENLWQASPMNANNNINGMGNINRSDVYTLNKNGGLLNMQEKMVRKIVDELKSFDNILYEICNEPYFGGVTIEWQHHIADIIVDAEKTFRDKHLITQNIANKYAKIDKPHPAVSVFNFHYASPPATVAVNYHLNRVIGDNETGFRGNSDSTYRMEGWRFILAGGALYNNLDYSFIAGQEKGTYLYPATQPGGGSSALRNQLSYLNNFINRFNFIKMSPDSNFIISGIPEKTVTQVLSQPGRQYALYIYGGSQATLELRLPAGVYEAEWMHPLTGKYEKKMSLRSKDGTATISSPEYREDIALRLTRK